MKGGFHFYRNAFLTYFVFLFVCLFGCFTVKESKFRRITDEIKGFGPYDGTRN